MPFDGDTYDSALDGERLLTQLDAVRRLMGAGRWWTLAELVVATTQMIGKRATEASVSARLRDLRKSKFGGADVERERAGGGLFRYRLVAPAPSGEQGRMF